MFADALKQIVGRADKCNPASRQMQIQVGGEQTLLLKAFEGITQYPCAFPAAFASKGLWILRNQTIASGYTLRTMA
jgi:hypothetical protein